MTLEQFCLGVPKSSPLLKKKTFVCLFSLVGQWALFTRFGPMGPIHPVWALVSSMHLQHTSSQIIKWSTPLAYHIPHIPMGTILLST